MFKFKIYLFLFVIVLASTTSAICATIGVRDINIGMSKQEVLDKLQSNKDSKCYENYCTSRDNIKKPVIITYNFGKCVKKLLSIGLIYNARYFSEMSDGISDKYGKPSAIKTVVWKNKAGISIDSLEYIWEFPEGIITINEHGNKFDEGEISMVSILVKEEMSQEKEKAKSLPGF